MSQRRGESPLASALLRGASWCDYLRIADDPRSDLIQYAECDAAAGMHFCESTPLQPTVPCVNIRTPCPALFKRPDTSPSTSPSNRPPGESGGTAPAQWRVRTRDDGEPAVTGV